MTVCLMRCSFCQLSKKSRRDTLTCCYTDGAAAGAGSPVERKGEILQECTQAAKKGFMLPFHTETSPMPRESRTRTFHKRDQQAKLSVAACVFQQRAPTFNCLRCVFSSWFSFSKASSSLGRARGMTQIDSLRLKLLALAGLALG